MSINFYSSYSVGVKTRNHGRKLLRTRLRSALGSFVITKSKTNIDPNALLLRKDNTRVFIIDADDINELMRKAGYTFNQAVAYCEAVTQIPHAVKNLYIYTNKKHEPPNSGSSGIRVMPKIIWFANSWDKHSWVSNMVKDDGGYPCFWTKDHTAMTDPFSKAWKVYDDKFPDRGWRIAYDVYETIDAVFSQLLEFIEMHQDEEVLHVWIQGSLQGDGPKEVVQQLQHRTSNIALNSTSLDPEVKVILMPSGSGKTYYSRKFEELIDVDDIYDGASGNQKLRRVNTMRNEEWAEHNAVNEEIISEFYNSGGLNGKILLLHSEDALGKLPYSVVGKYKVTRDELNEVLKEREDDELHAKMTLLNWKSSNFTVRTRLDLESDIVHIINSVTIPRNVPQIQSTEYTALWDTPIEKSVDLWDAYGVQAPTRIPVIPWRVSNLGPRIYKQGLPPQLFPSSTIMKKLNISMSLLNQTEIYGNYSKYVQLRPMVEEDVQSLDYGWRAVGNNLYALSEVTANSFKDLYKVDDGSFFMGCGSVVTAAHSCFGIGRSNDELLYQLERKLKVGHGTSGHMIASVLAYQSHFLWYLEEVFDNYNTGSSVYAIRFKEPESGVYHTIHEYRNAIHDMKRADANKLYPKYAKVNLEICSEFVRKLQL